MTEMTSLLVANMAISALRRMRFDLLHLFKTERRPREAESSRMGDRVALTITGGTLLQQPLTSKGGAAGKAPTAWFTSESAASAQRHGPEPGA